MKKFILFFILSILFISFGAFLINAYQLQKNYFDSKKQDIIKEESNVDSDDEISSSYTEYSKEQYDLAINKNRVLLLYFTSNWCNDCLEQQKTISKVFTGLNKEGVIGLTIHILDSETTVETDALAKKFDVTKENSIVILDKKGSVAFKNTGVIDEILIKQKIEEVVSK